MPSRSTNTGQIVGSRTTFLPSTLPAASCAVRAHWRCATASRLAMAGRSMRAADFASVPNQPTSTASPSQLPTITRSRSGRRRWRPVKMHAVGALLLSRRQPNADPADRR